MSKYTTELRWICKQAYINKYGKETDVIADIIQAGVDDIFTFDFPIFDPGYMNVLETKIVRHYYTREIGLETYGLWKLKLETLLNEIMPYYNKLYAEVNMDVNLFDNTDLVTERHGSDDGTSTDVEEETGSEDIVKGGKNTINRTGGTTTIDVGTTNTTANNTNTFNGQYNENDFDKYSDTPQGGLDGVSTGKYLTNARNINADHMTNNTTTDNGTNKVEVNDTVTTNRNETDTYNFGETDAHNKNVDRTKNGNFKNTHEWVMHVHGRNGGISTIEMLEKYQSSIIDIDMMIVDRLGELFMGLW